MSYMKNNFVHEYRFELDVPEFMFVMTEIQNSINYLFSCGIKHSNFNDKEDNYEYQRNRYEELCYLYEEFHSRFESFMDEATGLDLELAEMRERLANNE